MELTLFYKNFDGIVKYNSSKVTLTKNYIYTQCDAGSINGYELTGENTFPCSQRTCLREMGIRGEYLQMIILPTIMCCILLSYYISFQNCTFDVCYSFSVAGNFSASQLELANFPTRNYQLATSRLELFPNSQLYAAKGKRQFGKNKTKSENENEEYESIKTDYSSFF